MAARNVSCEDQDRDCRLVWNVDQRVTGIAEKVARPDAEATSHRLVFVDYLRGLAALSVSWFHLTNTYAQGSAVRLSGSYGWLGVEVFFVISGFIIPLSMSAFSTTSMGSYGRFIAKRALRVELPYLVSIGLVIALWYLSSLEPLFRGGEPHWSLEQIVLHVFYLIPFSDQAWLQPVYWTLAFEFVFYLFIGLALSPIVARSQRWPFCLLAFAVSFAVIAGVLSMLFLLFVMGCAAYRRFTSQGDVVECAVTVGASLAAMVLAGGWLEGIVGAATASLIIICASRKFYGAIGDGLAWLGSISYSLYLVHVPIGGRVVNFGKRFIEGQPLELMLSLAGLAVSIGFAWLFFRTIERPAHMLARLVRSMTETAPTVERLRSADR